jgi:putative inorganic carbon (HCO3(-)) transporter
MLLFASLIFFAFLSYFKPTFAVGLILAFLPTYLVRYEYQGLPTTYLELMLIVFLAVVFIQNFREIKNLRNLGKINWLILAFIAAGVISIFVSPEKRAAIGIFKAFVLEPVLFFYALKFVIKKPADLTTPLNLLFLGAITISVLGILQYLTFIGLPLKFWGTGEEVTRITSVFDYPNALALYLAPLCGFFFASLIFDDKTLNRKNLVLGLLVMLYALFLTFSRGAWIGFAVTSLIILCFRYPVKKVLAVTAAVAIFLFAIPQTRNRLLLITHDPSSAAHLDLTAAAWTKIKQSPVLGNGLSGFPTTLAQQSFEGEILNYPHNIFFNFWLEMGLLGLISFFGIIFVSVHQYKAVERRWYTTAAVAFMFIVIIHGLVDVPYFKNDLALLFWFVISIFYI